MRKKQFGRPHRVWMARFLHIWKSRPGNSTGVKVYIVFHEDPSDTSRVFQFGIRNFYVSNWWDALIDGGNRCRATLHLLFDGETKIVIVGKGRVC